MEQAASEKAASEALAKEKEKNSAILADIKVSSSTLIAPGGLLSTPSDMYVVTHLSKKGQSLLCTKYHIMCQGGTEFAAMAP